MGLAGLLAGLGIYAYNANILFLLALNSWIVWHLARRRDVPLKRRAGWAACFGATLALAAIPMARYALDPANDYFSHARSLSVFSAPDSGWPKEDGASPRRSFWARAVGKFWDNLSFHPEMDAGDSSGIVPVVPLGLLALGALGLVLVPKKERDALMGIGLWCAFFLPFGPTLTMNGLNRRAFALAPFLAFGRQSGPSKSGRRRDGRRPKAARAHLCRDGRDGRWCASFSRGKA